MSSNKFNVFQFMSDGFSALRRASRGMYDGESKTIVKFREEMFNPNRQTSDAENMKSDKKRIVHDIRKSYNKITLCNG